MVHAFYSLFHSMHYKFKAETQISEIELCINAGFYLRYFKNI